MLDFALQRINRLVFLLIIILAALFLPALRGLLPEDAEYRERVMKWIVYPLIVLVALGLGWMLWLRIAPYF